jgi:two-component system, OmpR family, phosphate regulon sensor histidine kinase PhoR
MKKKLMLSIITILTFNIIVITILFIAIENYQIEKDLKVNLEINNNMISVLLNNNSDINKFLNENYKNNIIRVTYISSDGKVLADSNKSLEELENHYNREEIIEAREKGTGTSIRHSDSTGENMLYYATKLPNGNFVRSSVFLRNGIIRTGNYIKYYFIIIALTYIISIILALKVSGILIRPIKELQLAASCVAKGDLDSRVNIISDDEIGQLGDTFNYMADQLKATIKDALDKQNRVEAILKSMESGVIAVDENYNVLLINPYALKIFNIKRDVIGENVLYVLKDEVLVNIIKERSEDYVEKEIYYPKERIIRIRTADIINGSEVIGIVAVIQDITDIRKLENMRSQFVANVSHELKTPLTSIKGFAETLKDVDDAATREKFLDIIDEEAERLTRLINDILILSDLENIKDDKFESINVKTYIENITALMKKSADDKNIKLEYKIEKDIYVKGNKDKFKQMLINLIDNAVKYTDNGGNVWISAGEDGISCIIEIADNGIGIDKKHLLRLFERFYRVDKARSRSSGGTGLGLAIVKHIVLSMEGSINVESEVSKGSKFIVKLPLYK